jgi:hypothetical protein
MPDWIARLHHSRRARNLTFAAIGLLTLGSSGGALLANYTMAGVDPRYTTPASEQVAAAEPETEWMRDVQMPGPRTEDSAEYQRTSY